MSRLLSAAFVCCAVSMASASVVPVGEFTGQMFEGFENVLPPGGYPGPISLFNGNVTMDDTLAHTCVISYVWQGPGGVVYPYDGNLFGGTVAGSTLFGFPTPVTDFGGFFTTVGASSGGTVVFRDAHGGLLDTLPLNVDPIVWAWQGWHSDVPIGSIEVVGANIPMASTQYDDLVLNQVPEPAAFGLLALGAAFILGRRR